MGFQTRASYLAIGWISALLFASAAMADGLSGTKPPNIVFLFTDDHAYQAMSCYGSKINQTPNLDRLAKSGMRFHRCLVTNSICGPSRAAILTGKYSHLNGFRQNGDRFDGSQMTFPKLLQGAGYQTAIFGKWHLASEPTGFDKWMVLPDQGEYYNPEFLTAKGSTKIPGYVTEIITEKTLDWLKNGREADKPFMLMVQHKAPHREWQPSTKHLDDLRDVNIPEPDTLFDDYSHRASVLAENKMEIGRHMAPQTDLRIWTPPTASDAFTKRFLNRLSPEQRSAFEKAYAAENDAYLANPPEGDAKTRYFYQRYIKDYLRCIASVDDSVGKVLDYLDSSGLAENTVVVYSSDQGFYLGEHGWYDKRWIFEESLKTPLLIRWPGVTKPNSTCDQIVSNLDFGETFLDMAGVGIPKEMQGQSLVPLLKGEKPADWRTSFYYHYYELGTHNVAAHEGVVTDRYKLIHYYRRLDENQKPQSIDLWDLMDRKNDVKELQSFIDDPDYQETRKQLEDELIRLRKSLLVPPN